MATKQLIEELTYQRDLWKADCLKLEAEVRMLEETIATLIREQAVLKDEDNRLLVEVKKLVEEIETLKQWIKDAKCALNGER